MPTKIQAYSQIADRAASNLTGSAHDWTAFLSTAARMYKYPYHEQLMIYAQRPNATACAEYDIWNNRMGRYVRRGSKGIAIIDTAGERAKLKYVFDVSDTSAREKTRNLNLWELRPEHINSISSMLEQSYEVSGDNLPDTLEKIAAQLADEYWNDNQSDILDIVDDSFLYGYDDFNVGVAFRNAATVSITYALMSRCGLEPETHFEHEDFLSVFDFNTPAAVSVLGTAVSNNTQRVLRQIEQSIRSYERSITHGNDIHQERGLSSTRPEPNGATGAELGQIRQDAESIPQGAPPNSLEQPDFDREIVPPLSGNRADSPAPTGTDDARADEIGRDYGEPESDRPDEVDGFDEQLQSTGGGNYPGGADSQLTEPPQVLQMTLFPSEAEQIAYIDEAEDVVRTPFAFSIAQEDIDTILRIGSNTTDSRMHIATAFAKGKPAVDIAELLQTEYHGGYGIRTATGSVTAWYAEDGIHLASGNSSQYVKSAQVIPWLDVADRIGVLLEQGEFARNVELAEAGSHERTKLAQQLWYLRQDLSDTAIEQDYLPTITKHYGGFPDSTQAIASLLQDPQKRQEIIDEFAAFSYAHSQEPKLLRFRFHKPPELYQRLKELNLPRTEYFSEMAELPHVDTFITEDEINATIIGGSSVEGGKGRIYEYFSASHTAKEKADFLKNEYGTSGRSHAVSKSDRSSADHSAKGMTLKKGDCYPVQLSWSMVAKRVDELVRKNRYFTPEQMVQHQNLQAVPMAEPTVEPEPPTPPRIATQADIDAALQAWNGNADSKLRVQSYMTEHARDRATAVWLQAEFGGSPTFPVAGDGIEPMELPWTKVQRHMAKLVMENDFLTEQEALPPRYQVVVYHHIENGFDEKLEYPTLQEAEKVAQSYVDGTLEADGFAYDGAAIYDLQEKQYLRVFGDYPDDAAHSEPIPEPTLDEPVQSSPAPIFFPDWQEAQQDIDLNLYQDGDVIGYDKEGVQYALGRSGALTYITNTTMINPYGEILGDKNIPSDILEQIKAYNRGELPEPQPEMPDIPAQNFRITDDELGVGGAKTKFRMNVDAIRTLQAIEADNRNATPEEQEILAKYVGWGGLADAFDDSKPNWSNEYKELAELLSPDEYAAARASTLNAHYTSPTVIRSIYEAVGNMGFQTGNILEPAMGVGNFFGCMPEEMNASKLYGVELDSLTGRMAKQLYPDANITVAGFETTDRRDFFDLAIGNVPFGQYQVNDRAYNKLGFSIHDYFFAKTLDQVRPGGVIAFVTSRYTMDKQSPEVRKYIAQRAEMLGAIRLPNNAFKANAGTEVVSDIIFLQKRDRPIEIDADWIHLGQNKDGFAINSYFVEHPEMVMGEQTSESTQYGKQDFTVAPIEGVSLAEQLHEAVQHIGGTYTEAELPDLGEGEEINTSIPADPNVKNFSYTLVNNEVYFRENSRMVKPSLNATAMERVRGMVELRDCVNKLIAEQMYGYVSDDTIKGTQAELNELYDKYTAKYGLINSRGNELAFSDDNSYFLLCSLEILDEDKNLKQKADIFSKRTIKPRQAVTSVDTPSEALALSISEKACVDMAYMEQLTGKDEDELVSALRGVIFRLPQSGEASYVTADDYLSGNVREKLRTAETALTVSDVYASNVEALRAAQPKDLDASEIEVRLGATWIDKDYVQDFMYELLDTPFYLRRSIEVNYAPYTAEWSISGKSSVGYNNINAYMTYGTERANAYRILEDTLNLRDIRIYDTKTDADGKERRVLNSKETTLAQQKQQAIKDAFQDWIWKDPTRRHTLTQKYNEIFNSTRPREYDGQHISFSGMNPEISLREHQLNAVAHVLYGGNTLLAHEVGAGKTFEMIAAAMESKRLGLCQKSLFAVPNHLTEQFAGDFLRLYPSANILVATRKDFDTKNRKKFCARIATGDYDAVIIGHSQFERIPVSMERQERLLEEQINEIQDGIEQLRYSRDERFTVKQLERTKKSLETKLEKLMSTERKDDVVTFEQLGVDRLYVDEAHSFKNLFLYTKMRNVAGLSTSDAQKSSDMFLKCRYIDEITNNKGIVFATGTPVSNSMTELYTMMRYLQHNTLKQKGLSHFDCWASTFGETSTAIELAPEGTGYRARTRFSKFFNLPELMTLFKEAADIKTSDQLNLPTPTPIYHNVVAQPTEIQKELVQELSERAKAVHSGNVDPSVDNMLKITSDGRKLGLDQRVINPDLPDEDGSKVNQCVDNVHRIWEDGTEDKLTQLIFCDLSTPKAAPSKKSTKTLDNPELNALEGLIEYEPEKPFSVYEDIREKLVARGIPKEQIAFIHEANTETKKANLFSKLRTGQVRVLIGSTAKCGAGMNVQDRLVALHDLDCPWRPGDLEQRSGRIIRQGNQNEEVQIFRYVTEATFDAYLWVRHEVA